MYVWMDGLNKYTHQVQKTVHLDFVWHIALLLRRHQNAIHRHLAITVVRMMATLQNNCSIFRISDLFARNGKQWPNETDAKISLKKKSVMYIYNYQLCLVR